MGFLGATFWWMTWNDDLYNTHPQNHQVFDVVCHLSLLVSDVGKFNSFNFCSLNCTGTVPMLSRELSHDRLGTEFSCISFSTLNACLGKKHLFPFTLWEGKHPGTIQQEHARRGRLCSPFFSDKTAPMASWPQKLNPISI